MPFSLLGIRAFYLEFETQSVGCCEEALDRSQSAPSLVMGRRRLSA